MAAFPNAVAFEIETMRLNIGRELARNNRAMLQIGSADDIIRAYVMRDILAVPGEDGNSPSEEAVDETIESAEHKSPMIQTRTKRRRHQQENE